MKYLLQISIYLFFLYGLHGQSSIDKTLRKFNKNSVPYITAESLAENIQFMLLDTREQGEFEVSHLANAIWVGNRKFDTDQITSMIPSNNSPIVVYCSVGVRSETVGERLLKEGYTEVYNLYGGIFEWKNKGFPVYDTLGKKTDKVHAYNKHWGKMLINATKVYGHRKQNN
jgi:rhodanese-related sulfurtransferase